MVKLELKDIKLNENNINGLLKILDRLFPNSRDGGEHSGTEIIPDRGYIYEMHYTYKVGITKRTVAEIHAELKGDKFNTSVKLNLPSRQYLELQTLTQAQVPDIYPFLSGAFASV